MKMKRANHEEIISKVHQQRLMNCLAEVNFPTLYQLIIGILLFYTTTWTRSGLITRILCVSSYAQDSSV